MAIADLFQNGVSGLLAHQRALGTISHNISNANTAGFSRQRVDMVTRSAQFTGAGYLGNGVLVSDIERIQDDFLVNLVRGHTASTEYDHTYYIYAQRLDNLLANEDTGISPTLDGFFNALQDLAGDPSSITTRESVLASARTLADRFQFFDQQFESLQNNIQSEMRNSVSSINDLTGAIADANSAIVRAMQSDARALPNDLLDRRDLLLEKLSEQVSVFVVAQDDGALNVFVGNGQQLVVGDKAQSLAVQAGLLDPQRLEISLGTIAAPVITSQVSGGKLGGLLDFREHMLDPARNELGRLATVLSRDINEQHRLGMDINGLPGGDFFQPGDQLSPVTYTRSSAVLDVTISDVSVLGVSDYLLGYDGTNYTLTRLQDNTVVDTFAGFPRSVGGEGLSLAITGAPVAGDQFLIRPTRFGSREFGLAVDNAADIAAAAPIVGNADLSNTGDAVISSGRIMLPPPTDPNLLETVEIVFNNPPTSFNVTGTGTGNPIGVVYSSGSDISFNGWTVQVTGSPVAGDRFVISRNTDGVSDNRNVNLLARLESLQRVDGGASSYGENYLQLVSRIGSGTRSLGIGYESQAALLAQSVGMRESVSGVNLDEEAANLMRFEKAYQANAQVIATADTLFQTLLAAVGR